MVGAKLKEEALMDIAHAVEEEVETVAKEIAKALSPQALANETEEIKRVLDSVPAQIVEKLLATNPTLATVMEAIDRLAAVVAQMLPAPTNPPVPASPEIVAGRTKKIQALFDTASNAPRHYTTLPDKPAAIITPAAPEAT
jgi:hypothetical protein